MMTLASQRRWAKKNPELIKEYHYFHTWRIKFVRESIFETVEDVLKSS